VKIFFALMTPGFRRTLKKTGDNAQFPLGHSPSSCAVLSTRWKVANDFGFFIVGTLGHNTGGKLALLVALVEIASRIRPTVAFSRLIAASLAPLCHQILALSFAAARAALCRRSPIGGKYGKKK